MSFYNFRVITENGVEDMHLDERAIIGYSLSQKSLYFSGGIVLTCRVGDSFKEQCFYQLCEAIPFLSRFKKSNDLQYAYDSAVRDKFFHNLRNLDFKLSKI